MGSAAALSYGACVASSALNPAETGEQVLKLERDRSFQQAGHLRSARDGTRTTNGVGDPCPPQSAGHRSSYCLSDPAYDRSVDD